MIPTRPATSVTLLAVASSAWVSCAPAAEEDAAEPNPSKIVQLLAAGQPVFGIFSGDHTAEQGATMVQNREIDFVFYSLERGPFDIPTMQAYMQGMADGAGGERGGRTAPPRWRFAFPRFGLGKTPRGIT